MDLLEYIDLVGNQDTFDEEKNSLGAISWLNYLMFPDFKLEMFFLLSFTTQWFVAVPIAGSLFSLFSGSVMFFNYLK